MRGSPRLVKQRGGCLQGFQPAWNGGEGTRSPNIAVVLCFVRRHQLTAQLARAGACPAGCTNKKATRRWLFHEFLVRPERFERPTPWFVAKYSIQLSYGRTPKLLCCSTEIFNLRQVVLLVRPERFERPTPWFVAKYSIQLSYGRTVRAAHYTDTGVECKVSAEKS
jgi:hypothetical protein